MKEGLKFKMKGLEDVDKLPKLLIINVLRKEQTMKQVGETNVEFGVELWVGIVEEDQVLLKARSLGDGYEDLSYLRLSSNLCLTAAKFVEKESLIISMEAQLFTHCNEGTSGSSHSNLDPMKVIMHELQLMRKDMKQMRGNITNLSMEHRDQNNIGGHVTSHTQQGYGNFSPHARTFEHKSYDCYEDNRLGTRSGYNDRSYKKVPRNEVKLMEPSKNEECPQVKELSQDKIEESLKIHVVKETSEEKPCDFMSGKDNEK
ncbi:hypothetical protein M9H77_08589 [Catharanthus roseus]|uniref:Uncharacterized protein n=1 Tax=Catharanthus roseus TaxID=4058 RepID=A0ACC0BYH5_CATRO|nr:hypothetical protein M9H77_08589 [Catharanthus roseus]